MIVSDFCDNGIHAEANYSFEKLLIDQHIGLLSGVDTRDLVHLIRDHGAMKCMVEVLEGEERFSEYEDFQMTENLVASVSQESMSEMNPQGDVRIALLDF